MEENNEKPTQPESQTSIPEPVSLTHPTQNPYPALRKENKSNFLSRNWVQILSVLLFGFALALGLIFFLNTTKPKATNKTSSQTPASSSASTKTETKHLGYVNSETGLNLREEASAASSILQTLPNGTEVNILSESGEWYLVEATTRGYLSKEFVSQTKPAKTLKVYSFDELNLKFIYPESYDVKVTKGEPNTFKFGSTDSSGGFTISKTASGTTIKGYLTTALPTAQTSACDITIGNASECSHVKTDTDDFYLANGASNILKIAVLTNFGNFPSDLTAIIFPTFYFPQ